MSFQVGSACYSTQQAAAQVSASIQVGSIANHSNTSYFIDVESTTSNSISYSLTPLTGGLPIIVVILYSAQPCNLLSLEDGLSMGWKLPLFGFPFIA